MLPEEALPEPTDRQIETVIGSGFSLLVQESVKFIPDFSQAWGDYQRIIGPGTNRLHFFVDETGQKYENTLVKNFKEKLNNIGLDIERSTNSSLIITVVSRHKFRDWIDSIKRVNAITPKDSSNIISICEILLKQLYKKEVTKNIEPLVNLLVSVSDICELGEYVSKHSVSEFFEQDYKNLNYLKDAVSGNYVQEYLVAVQAGIIDTGYFSSENFPWIGLSYGEFEEKSKILKEAFEKLISVYMKNTSHKPVYDFLHSIFSEWKQKIDSYSNSDYGITREKFFMDMQPLLETVL